MFLWPPARCQLCGVPKSIPKYHLSIVSRKTESNDHKFLSSFTILLRPDMGLVGMSMNFKNHCRLFRSSSAVLTFPHHQIFFIIIVKILWINEINTGASGRGLMKDNCFFFSLARWQWQIKRARETRLGNGSKLCVNVQPSSIQTLHFHSQKKTSNAN